jgi:molybdopterin molybdotransferase
MLTVEAAQRLVLAASAPLKPVTHPLARALGLVLAEPVASDMDMPPYDKALVDGFAVRFDDLATGPRALEIAGEVAAGQSSDQLLNPGCAVRIMTGAPVPPGADTVVMVEHTSHRFFRHEPGGSEQSPQSARFNGLVSIDDHQLRLGQNIMRRGTELRGGQVVLEPGRRIRPPEVGLLASVGRNQVLAYPRPRVAILATGDEIVEIDDQPGPGQIRNSNGPTLAALTVRAGGEPEYLGISRDSRDELYRRVRMGLQADILVLSGGVSAGQFDLVPDVLQELGVREVFHRVNLRPGKPVWFGTTDHHQAQGAIRSDAPPGSSSKEPSAPSPAHRLVFGLPGNPVSVMVCFELFVRHCIERMMGVADPHPRLVRAALQEPKTYRSERPTYWPAWVEPAESGFRVRPVAWHGSPDLRATTDANAFVLFPAGEHQFQSGDSVQVLLVE